MILEVRIWAESSSMFDPCGMLVRSDQPPHNGHLLAVMRNMLKVEEGIKRLWMHKTTSNE